MVMTEEKIKALDELDFDWGSLETRPKRANVSFEQGVEQLQAYKETHGHVHVKVADDKNLFEFNQNMRKCSPKAW